MKYTPSQQKAIDTKNNTLLLSAAAGSGKTAVLVQRIIEMISDNERDTDIGDLLVVTYTKLAASQMKDRIRKALNEKIKENKDKEQTKKLKKQLLNISGAEIQTIHSFCLNVIKSNINRLDIPVNFRVADDSMVAALKERTFEEFFQEKYEKEDEKFLNLLDSYAYSGGEESLKEIISSLCNIANAMAQPNDFFDMCLNNVKEAGENFQKSVYCDILLSHCREVLKNNVKKYSNILEYTTECDQNGKTRDFFYEEYCVMENLLTEENPFVVVEKLWERKEMRKPNGRGEANSIVSPVRDEFKKDVDELKKYFCCDFFEEEENQRKIYPYVEAIVGLTKEFMEKFSENKKKKSILEFSDFEHFALKILKNEDGTLSDTARSYQKKYKEILIDEYQDTSDIQNAIFLAISRDETNLFMVGDVKQSIYKFRLACPEIFAEKENEYSQSQTNGEVIALAENFRSRKEVLESVNAIFSPIMNLETGITDYETQKLKLGGNFGYNKNFSYKTTVLLFDNSDKNIPEKYEGFDGEGLMIAQNIKKLVEKDGEFICVDKEKGIFRKCEYSDIVILTRNMTDSVKKIYDVLVNFGIPVTADFADNMFEQPEILMIINALKCIDNPRDDFALLSFLKSPVWRFSENKLLEIRRLSKNTPFYDALLKSEDEQVKIFLSKLFFLRNFAFSNDVSATVEKIYDDLELYQRFSSFKNPENRIMNLDEFYKIALEYDKTENGGLKGFLFYIRRACENPKKVTDTKGTITNSVQMMTMHKSKGLEFPVVFVSGLSKPFSSKEIKGNILINSDIGIGVDVMAKDNLAFYRTLSRNAVKCKIINDEIGEEMRLLYVALTRAEDKLFITANISTMEKSMSDWISVKESGGFTKNYLYKNRKFISWIMPTVLSDEKEELFELYDEYNYENLTLEPEIFSEDEREMSPQEDMFVFEKYKDAEKTTLPVKVTVSSVNREENMKEEKFFGVTLDELDNVNEKTGGSEYGTYFHRIFELSDISRIKNKETVNEIISELIEKNVVEETSYTKKAILQTENFFKTEVGKELLQADEVFKEKPFLVRIEADKTFETNRKDNILLQGTSDCYFIKNNEITLIDFKTNKNTDENYIKSEYSKQMELYAYAIEKVTGLKVVKKVIYTAQNGKIIYF